MDIDTIPAHLTFKNLNFVLSWTTIGKSTLHAMVASGTFPKPVRMGRRRVAWRWSDLQTWAENRVSE